MLLLSVACAAPSEPTCVDLRASDDGRPWQVDPGADSYPCFAFEVPFDASWTVTRWAPLVDDELALHHFVIYRTATTLDHEALRACTPPRDATIVAAWSPGNEGMEMPDGIGLELAGPGEHLLLQMHYLGLDETEDQSGVRICAVNRTPQARAGTLVLGTAAFEIPPRARGHMVTHRCLQRRDVPLTALAASPHMHRRGRSIESVVRRGGLDSPAETILRVDPFDYDRQVTQMMHPPTVLQPGDVLETTCVYDNPTAEAIRYGTGIEDEMCFDYLTVYPIDAFESGAARFCF